MTHTQGVFSPSGFQSGGLQFLVARVVGTLVPGFWFVASMSMEKKEDMSMEKKEDVVCSRYILPSL